MLGRTIANSVCKGFICAFKVKEKQDDRNSNLFSACPQGSASLAYNRICPSYNLV